MRTRPVPFISVSNAPTRSPRPVMDSMGGLARTGTLTSTCGNLRMQVASEASGSPVSRPADSSASAERIRSLLLPLLLDVAVAHLRLHHANARGLQALVETEIGHHGGDHEVRLEPT